MGLVTFSWLLKNKEIIHENQKRKQTAEKKLTEDWKFEVL